MKHKVYHAIALTIVLGVSFACEDQSSSEPNHKPQIRDVGITVGNEVTNDASISENSSSCDGGMSGECSEMEIAEAEDASVNEEETCRTGVIRGVVCAPNKEPVVGALVTVEIASCTGELITYQTQTNARGGYQITDVTHGEGHIIISAGSFTNDFEITVEADQVLDLSEAQTCFKVDSTHLAVVSGDFDSIEDSIERLGFRYDTYCGDSVSNYGARALLSNASMMAQYDIIFLNCGNQVEFLGEVGERITANLRSFVEGGGSLYVSDLSSGILDAVFPSIFSFQHSVEYEEILDECCTCTDNCPSNCGADVQTEIYSYHSMCMGTIAEEYICFGPYVDGYGEVGLREATIENENLRNALGRDSMTIDFDSPGWVELSESNPQVETLVGGEQPYMVRYTSNAGGRVIFTSFHNHHQPSEDLEKILRAIIFEL